MGKHCSCIKSFCLLLCILLYELVEKQISSFSFAFSSLPPSVLSFMYTPVWFGHRGFKPYGFLSLVAFKSTAVVNAFPTKSSLWKYFYKVLYLMRTSEQRRCKNITGGRIYLFIITKAVLLNICFYLSWSVNPRLQQQVRMFGKYDCSITNYQLNRLFI